MTTDHARRTYPYRPSFGLEPQQSNGGHKNYTDHFEIYVEMIFFCIYAANKQTKGGGKGLWLDMLHWNPGPWLFKRTKKKLEGKLPLLAVDPIDLMILQPFQVY